MEALDQPGPDDVLVLDRGYPASWLIALLNARAIRFGIAAAMRLGRSARSFHRVLRMARSVTDLAGAPAPQGSHLVEAIQCRRVLAAG